MRTTVRLNEHLLRQAKQRASEKGETLTSLIEQGLRMVLAEPTPLRRRKRVKIPVSHEGGGVVPGVDLSNSAALLDRMEGRV